MYCSLSLAAITDKVKYMTRSARLSLFLKRASTLPSCQWKPHELKLRYNMYNVPRSGAVPRSGDVPRSGVLPQLSGAAGESRQSPWFNTNQGSHSCLANTGPETSNQDKINTSQGTDYISVRVKCEGFILSFEVMNGEKVIWSTL